MTLKQEIYRDIIEHCDLVLDLLRTVPPERYYAEPSVIHDCEWLKRRASAHSLPLPAKDRVGSLRYVSAERLLSHLASAPDRYDQEIGIHLYRLLYLVDGRPLLKPAYYSYAVRCVDALIVLLRSAARPLDPFEQGSIGELMQLRQGLIDGSIEPPLMYYLPVYRNLRNVYGVYESSVDDLRNGKFLMEAVNELFFEGVRPDTWITPEAADRETDPVRS